jgi:hypothetical protein
MTSWPVVLRPVARHNIMGRAKLFTLWWENEREEAAGIPISPLRSHLRDQINLQLLKVSTTSQIVSSLGL